MDSGTVPGDYGPALGFSRRLYRPDADDPRLVGGFCQQQDGNLGLDVVVPGRDIRGPIGFQEAHETFYISR